MKKLIITIISLLIFNNVYTQDIIIKRNGEEIKSKVIEVGTTEVKYKKIDNINGPIFSIFKSDVFMIKYENGTKDVFNEDKSVNNSSNQSNEQNQLLNRRDHDINKTKYKQSGFTNITEVNIGLELQHLGLKDYHLGIQTINGYQFSSLLSTGIGIGFDNTFNNNFIPIFLDIRSNFINGIVSPFIVGDIGYSFLLNKNSNYTYKGGLLINPCLGIKFFISSATALNFSIGYLIQKYTVTSNYDGYNNYIYYETEKYITIKLGVTF